MTEYLQNSPMPYLEGPEVVDRIQTYYDPNGRYSGRRFEFLDGGGDQVEVAHVFTAADIVAVSMLSINVPGSAAIEILETRSEELSDLLSEIPLGVTLWDAEEAVVDDHDSVAAHLYRRLREIKSVGPVTANKLIARKRTQLLPVWDSVVGGALQPESENFWIPLRNSLLKDNRAILNRLGEIKSEAQLDVDPPLLRVLDVAVWMAASQQAEGADGSESSVE
jgi:hypothetical protein